MIRFCKWCEQYMGEKAPFDDKSITHGICVECAERIRAEIPLYRQEDKDERISGHTRKA